MSFAGGGTVKVGNNAKDTAERTNRRKRGHGWGSYSAYICVVYTLLSRSTFQNFILSVQYIRVRGGYWDMVVRVAGGDYGYGYGYGYGHALRVLKCVFARYEIPWGSRWVQSSRVPPVPVPLPGSAGRCKGSSVDRGHQLSSSTIEVCASEASCHHTISLHRGQIISIIHASDSGFPLSIYGWLHIQCCGSIISCSIESSQSLLLHTSSKVLI